ncbi:endonuclease NucS domain-containing protein [Natranaeroarchaeum aerophilus]|uniref:Endonuclease NucS n=1 Tax=Natranaeroarchaeum aerophilus TaxID=2917711 RepID=A0AAE3K6R6_9EURY|nr:endonuclease NucS domain-containing protein [Natranaeroarchaeum aerophilus]MCL9815278.1 endonuclease NucS [Natranaeroarchaeum aerophilus]
MTEVFLIQATGDPTDRPPAETKADEPIGHGFYNHPNWHNQTKDEDFGEVEEGDIILLYCTGNVEACPKQIKYIFQVTGKEEDRLDGSEIGVPNKLLLEELHRLSPGFPLEKIRQWVEDGKLSDAMNRAGTQGFNITNVEKADYEAITEWTDSREPEPTIEHYEEELRNFIANHGLGVISDEYANYELYQDADSTGELYTTPIGEIDLVYQHPESGELVIVELKRTQKTSDKVVGQIARYLGWAEAELAVDNQVHGLIVTQTASERLKYAVRALKDCELATYKLNFHFEMQN